MSHERDVVFQLPALGCKLYKVFIFNFQRYIINFAECL